MSKIISFFDKHRLILILLILIIIAITFVLIKLYSFNHHTFNALTCTNSYNDTRCYHDNLLILKDPDATKNTIFEEYASFINDLQNEYHLSSFNFYTAYYYALASDFEYHQDNRNVTLNAFFQDYVATYNLKEFYKKNVLFYDIYYPFTLT